MANILRQFSDIDLTFEPHPATGDLVGKYNENNIRNSVKNLILTRHYERPFHSEIGSNVNKMMFENPTPGVVVLLRREIEDVIRNFEPRVQVLDIDIIFSPDSHYIYVTLVFLILNTTRPITVEFALNRTR
jgi:phage baseplate assembly protein W